MTIQNLSGSTAVTGSAIDTENLDNGMIHVRAEVTTSNPSVATVAVTLTECATVGGTYAPALDNTGVRNTIFPFLPSTNPMILTACLYKSPR